MYDLQNIVAALKMPQYDKENFSAKYWRDMERNLKEKKEVADLSATEVAADWEA